MGGFVDGIRARGCAVKSCGEWERYLLAAGRDGLGWRTLRDMDRGELERWLSMRAVTPKDPEKPESVMGARVHNCHVTAFSAFGNWCSRHGYTKGNPFAGMVKRDERADRRHVRRALTVDELARLFDAARPRPMLEAARINRGPDKGKAGAVRSARTLDRLRFLGWTRSFAYKTAALTGLRWGELRSITIGAARLDADTPHFILEARNEKARRGVAVFDVPVSMGNVFNADCKATGISKRDGAGRVVDVHALRHTFGTLLAKAGVSLQVAQRAMRHSTPALTANVYTHLGLLDVAGAVNAMPPMIKQDASAQVMSECANGGAPNGALTTGILSAPQALSGVADIGHDYSTDSGEESVLTNNGAGLQRVALKENGGRYRTRTCDILRVRQTL